MNILEKASLAVEKIETMFNIKLGDKERELCKRVFLEGHSDGIETSLKLAEKSIR